MAAAAGLAMACSQLSSACFPGKGRALPWCQQGARGGFHGQLDGETQPAVGEAPGEWRSPHWQGYLRLDFERGATLQLGTMLHCQRDGLNYLIGLCCVSPVLSLSRTHIQLGYFSWEDSAVRAARLWKGEAGGAAARQMMPALLSMEQDPGGWKNLG